MEGSTPFAVAVGANVDDARGMRLDHFEAGVRGVTGVVGVVVDAVSEVYETPPVGPAEQGAYLNGVIVGRAVVAAGVLLESLHAIERSRGRERSREKRWGPRTLDLDLLLFGDAVIEGVGTGVGEDAVGLRVPHPRLGERAFVLVPLAEVAGGWRVPPDGERVSDLLEQLPASDREACRGVGRFDDRS